MNTSNIPTIMPSIIPTTSPTGSSSNSFNNSILTPDDVVYFALGIHLFIFLLILILNELIKYHILEPRKTQQIINALTSVVNRIPTL